MQERVFESHLTCCRAWCSRYATRCNDTRTKCEILAVLIDSSCHAALCLNGRNVVFRTRALCAPASLVEQFLYQSKAAGWKSTSWADSGAAAPD